MISTDDTPRIYVASLADYNAGRLHGRWIDATQELEAIQEEIAAMLASSREPIAEEYAIHDYDGGLGTVAHAAGLGEYESLERVHEVAEAIEEHGASAIAAYLSNDPSADLADFEEAYCGRWDSEKDYAENLAEELGAVPQEYSWPQSYIDWEAAARDLFMGDYWSADAGAPDYGVHVFRGI